MKEIDLNIRFVNSVCFCKDVSTSFLPTQIHEVLVCRPKAMQDRYVVCY